MLGAVAFFAALVAPFQAISGIASDIDGAGVSENYPPVDDYTLDDMRGGFLVAGGLELSFSIERAVMIDGELVSRTVIAVPRSDAAASSPAVTMPLSGFMTLIQNAVDFKTIENLTIIDLEVSNLRSIAVASFGAMLTDQIVNSVR